MAALISASGDGAWLAAFIQQLGMRPVRGSRYNRGAQAVRELMKVLADGGDIAVTPDGSRGPMYDMKAGAVAVALKTGAPIVLLSFNFNGAWRLKSWDRFYILIPSRGSRCGWIAWTTRRRWEPTIRRGGAALEAAHGCDNGRHRLAGVGLQGEALSRGDEVGREPRMDTN